MLLQMAFKNVTRNRKRTLLTLAAVFWGVFLTIVANGFNKGFEWQTGNLYIKTDSSSVKIVAWNFKIDDLENPVDYPLRDFQPVLRALDRDPNVRAYSPRVSFHGGLSNGINEIRGVGIGIEPKAEDEVFRRSEGIVRGHFLKPGESGIVVGEELAKLLELRIGDTVTVIAQATQMGTNAADLEVKGFIRTDNPALDSLVFLVPLQFARDFLSFTGVTDIAVSLRNNGRIKRFQSEFPKNLGAPGSKGIKVLSWRDFARDYIQLVEFRGRMINVLTTMILLMAAAGIMNTMLMAMMERRQEVGNLMALGVRRGEILRLFLTEGLAIGFLGSLMGMILGVIIVLYFQANGIPLGNDVAEKLGSTPVAGGRFYMYLEPLAILTYFGMGVFVAALSAVYPAVKTAKLRPVEAIRDNRG